MVDSVGAWDGILIVVSVLSAFLCPATHPFFTASPVNQLN
jgi:hypothetical protein